MGEDPQALVGRVAVEAHHDRLGRVQGVERPEDAFGDLRAGGDAAVHVDEHGPDLRVGEHDLQAGGHDLGRGAAADVEEVGGLDSGALLLAGAGHGVQGAHDQAGAVADHADLAVQVHVVQAVLAGAQLVGVGIHRIGEALPAVVAECGVVVQRDLRVERAQGLRGLVVGIADLGERVDLHQRGVGVLEALPHLEQDLRRLVLVGVVEADAVGHGGRRLEVEVAERVDVQALDGLRVLLGDLLDLGAAVGRGQHVEVARGTVHGDGHVVLVQDVLGLRDEHAVHLVTVDGHGQDAFGEQDGLVAVPGELDAACLAAMADLHLRLDDARIAELVGRLGDLMRVLRVDRARRGDVLLLEQLPCLVFIQIHRCFQPFPVDGGPVGCAVRPAW